MSDYWIKREEEQRKKDRKNDQAASKRLHRIYAGAISEMESQIDAWFAKYANENGITMAEAKKLASTLDIKQYSQLAKLYVQTNDRSDKANKEMSIYNLTMKTSRLELLIMALNDAMVQATGNTENLVKDEIQSRIKEEYQRQAGILGETVPGSLEQALETLTYASFHSAKWSTRIWKNNETVRKLISRTLNDYLIRGIATNKAIQELKSHIKDDVKKAENAARRLVVTERQRVAGQAQMKIYEDSGIRYFRFIAEPNCCKICAGLEGQVFEVAKGESGINMRPMHPYCRCSTAMATDPADAKFNDWLSLYDVMDPKDIPSWSEYKKPVKREKIKKFTRIPLGEPMEWDDADLGRPNPNFFKGPSFRINCQTCVVAFEARLRGHVAQAKANKRGSASEQVSYDTSLAWIDPKTGAKPEYLFPKGYSAGYVLNDASMLYTPDMYFDYLDDVIKAGQRYHVSFGWKNSRSGHIVTVQRDKKDGNLFIYDPQIPKCNEYEKHAYQRGKKAITAYLKRISFFRQDPLGNGARYEVPKLLRVDNLDFNYDIVNKMLTKSEEKL